MLKIGLTGGIASGKSAVAAILRELGFPVLDADALAHKLMEPGRPAHDEILGTFGPQFADACGRIDRTKLAALVFGDSAKLKQLNAIVHPRVEERIFWQFEEWRRSGVRDAGFVEAALLIEAGIAGKLDGIVVAWSETEQQLGRMRARGMNEADARRRMAAQLPLEQKLRQATYTIDCSGSLEETRAQVQVIAAKIRHRAASLPT